VTKPETTVRRDQVLANVWRAQLAEAARTPWLAALILREGDRVSDSFVRLYSWLRNLPRRWRRLLRRKVRIGLSGIALLLALCVLSVRASVIAVNTPIPDVVPDGLCSLIEALENANDTTTGQPHPDCEPGDPGGADTVVLPQDSVHTLTQVHNTLYGPSGLPVLSTEMTIEANGATIERSDLAPEFRIATVGPGANVTINDLTVRGGRLSPIVSSGASQNPFGKPRARWNAKQGLLNPSLRQAIVSGDVGAVGSIPSANGDLADQGGGLLVLDGRLALNDSYAYDNVAAQGGGVAVVSDASSAELQSNSGHFWGNTAEDLIGSARGGAVHNSGGVVEFYDFAFTENDAFLGGAVHNTDGGTVRLYTADLTGNTGAMGAGLYNTYYGYAYLSDCEVRGNTATQFGGGVSTGWDGHTVIVGGLIVDNDSGEFGGGADTYRARTDMIGTMIMGNSALGGGGMSCIGGILTLDGLVIDSNNADDLGGGVFGDSCIVDVRSSNLSGNTASSRGGGFSAQDSAYYGDWNIDDVTIRGNSADDGGGFYSFAVDVVVLDSTIEENIAASDGGGLYCENGDIDVSNTEITGNTAGDDGGGIFNNGGSARIANSTLSSNSSNQGGGIANHGGEMVVRETSVVSNQAAGDGPNSGGGGGVFSTGGSLELDGALISDNEAVGDGGGLKGLGTRLELANSTFSGNTAHGQGTGLFVVPPSAPGEVFVRNTSVAAGTGGGAAIRVVLEPDHSQRTLAQSTLDLVATIIQNDSGPDCSESVPGLIRPIGFNLDTDGTCVGEPVSGGRLAQGTNITADPMLLLLADNGGPTWTHALADQSPALEGIPIGEGGCGIAPNDVDQRGFPRPGTKNQPLNKCEIGAWEAQVEDPTGVLGSTPTPTPTSTSSLVATPTPTPSATLPAAPTPTLTASPTPTTRTTDTSTPTPTEMSHPTATCTPTQLEPPTGTSTPTPTELAPTTPSPTSTATRTAVPPTSSPSLTHTPSPTRTGSGSPTPTPTEQAPPTATPTSEPSRFRLFLPHVLRRG